MSEDFFKAKTLVKILILSAIFVFLIVPVLIRNVLLGNKFCGQCMIR